MNVNQLQSKQGTILVDRSDSTLMLRLAGPWHLSRNLPSASTVLPELAKKPALKRVSSDTPALSGWTSGLFSFLLEVESACRQRGIKDDREGLPAGLRRLIELAEAV